jgi:hypothetical protein
MRIPKAKNGPKNEKNPFWHISTYPLARLGTAKDSRVLGGMCNSLSKP